MAQIVADRIRDTTTTTGTGAVTVSGTAPATYLTFSARCSVNDTLAYFIAHQSADEWECGIGTYSASNQLTRTTVLSSSNSDAAVSFSAGTKDVVLTQVADRGYQNNGFAIGSDVFLNRDAAGVLSLRNFANAQTFRVYNTYTDASNYERGIFDWTTTANTLTIGTEKGGTGSARNIAIVFPSGATLSVNGNFTIDQYGDLTNTGGQSNSYSFVAVNNFKTSGTNGFFAISNGGVSTGFGGYFAFTSGNDPAGTIDTQFSRNAAGVIEVNSGTPGTLRDLTLRNLFTNNASFILRSTTTATGGATGNVPTLTAGPVTGNPTKWLPYDDNGVTRYIPSW